MPNYHIGIDPGKTGYIVAIDGDGSIAWSLPMPETATVLASKLKDYADCYFIVERQFAMHGQGLSSTFTIAQGYGEILGVLAGIGAGCNLVRSQDWQKVMLRGEGKAKGRDLKRLYVAVAERMWPTISFRGPKGGAQDGKAAAALIAEYGRRVSAGRA